MKNKKGFTIVELLVVILILGVLLSIALPAIFNMNKRIKDRSYDSKIEMIETAAINYAQNHANALRSAVNTKLGITHCPMKDANGHIINHPSINDSIFVSSMDNIFVKYDCIKDTLKGNSSSQKDDDYKYVFDINVLALVDSGELKSDDTNNNCPEDKTNKTCKKNQFGCCTTCNIVNPNDNSMCLDCMMIEIWLDNDHKNATAYYGKTTDISDAKYKTLDKKSIKVSACNNKIITPLE